MTRQNRTEADGLTPRQRRFVGAVLGGANILEASRACEVSDRTGQRYMQLPGVRLALTRVQDAAIATVTRRAVLAMSAALDTLEHIMADGVAPYPSRVSAARAILEGAVKLVETTTLAERVSALEEALEGQK